MATNQLIPLSPDLPPSMPFGPTPYSINVGGKRIPLYRGLPWHKDEPIEPEPYLTQEGGEPAEAELE